MNKASTHSPSVYIIFLNWNNSEETLQCLESLRRISYNNFSVVIVDNNSTDDSLEHLRKFQKEQTLYPVDIIENSENSGFSGGNNIGIKHALEKGADYVLILNNDTTVEPMFLDNLVDAAEKNKEAGLLGSAIYFTEPRDILWFGGDTKIKWKKMDKGITCDLYKKELPPLMPDLEVNFITGACMLFKREVLEEVEGFDERFFLYFEDVDLSLRVKEAGYKLIWVPKSTVWHKVSATTLPQVGSPKLHYYHVRNVMLLGFKHGPWWLYIYHPFWAMFEAGKQIIKIIIGRNPEISKARLRGILDYYRERFGQYEKIYD